MTGDGETHSPASLGHPKQANDGAGGKVGVELGLARCVQDLPSPKVHGLQVRLPALPVSGFQRCQQVIGMGIDGRAHG
jgi:hypothetical protein